MGGEVQGSPAHAAALDLDLGAAHRLPLHRGHGVGALAGADRAGEHRLGVPPGAGGRAPRTSASAPAWLAAVGGGALRASATSAASARGSPGPARVAFVIGLDRYFPPAFGRVHPRWQTPYVAILTQAVLATRLPAPVGAREGDHGREGVSRHPRHDAAGLLHPLPLPVRLLPGGPAQGAPRRPGRCSRAGRPRS